MQPDMIITNEGIETKMLSQNEMITQLRDRLRLVSERIMEREEVERETCNSDAAGDDLRCVLATGALQELRSEAAFLAGILAQDRDAML